MIHSRKRAGGYFCPVCGGTDLESKGPGTYYDTRCRGCGAEFYTDGLTPEDFAEEVELGADNLDWNALDIGQVMRMASNMDPKVAEAFRDPDLALWIENYFGYVRGISHGNDPSNREWAEDMGSLVRFVMDDPSDIVDFLSSNGVGYVERDLIDRLSAVHVRYGRR